MLKKQTISLKAVNNSVMKRLAVFISFILLCVGFMLTENKSIYNIPGLSKVCFVTYDQLDNTETVETLQYNYVYCNPSEASLMSEKINKVGIINYFKKCEKRDVLDSIGGYISTVEKIDGVEIICGYAPIYNQCLYIKNKKINFQMAVKEEEIILGFPLILGSF